MAKAVLNPFTPEQLALADSIIQSADQVLDFYLRCERCQMDVAEVKQQVQAYRDFAQAVKDEFSGTHR